MKRKLLSLIMLIGVTISVTGCSLNFNRNKEEAPSDAVQVISVEVDESVPNITDLSKAEILGLTASDVKKSVETYLPSYRTIYKIDDNKTMTDADWLSLRDIICTQFYGDAKLGTATAQVGFDDDKNAIYYAPVKSSIEAMSLVEFGNYLNGLYTYMYGDQYLTKAGIDFKTYNADVLQSLKTDFLRSLK